MLKNRYCQSNLLSYTPIQTSQLITITQNRDTLDQNHPSKDTSTPAHFKEENTHKQQIYNFLYFCEKLTDFAHNSSIQPSFPIASEQITLYQQIISLNTLITIIFMSQYQSVGLNFKSFIKTLEQRKTINNKWFEIASDNYAIEEMGLETIGLQQVKNMHQDILRKYQNRQLKKTWCENENKILIWMVCQWEFCSARKLQEFLEQDWEMINNCLPRKTLDDVKFQMKMLSKLQPNDMWSQDQLKLLNNIIKQQKLENKWNQVSKQLFKLSDQKYFRRPKQCREQWKNHPDPGIQKGDWTIQNDCQLLEFVLDLGKRWSSISKCIGTRTQHSVKNRFNSLVRQYQKIFKKNNKEKAIGKKKDQEEQLIKYILRSIKQTDAVEQQKIKKCSQKKKNPIKSSKTSTKNEAVASQQTSKSIYQSNVAVPAPQPNIRQVMGREEIDNRIGYVYSPRTPYTAYLDTNKHLGNLLFVNSPRIISPTIKMLTRWEDFDNKEYFYEM